MWPTSVAVSDLRRTKPKASDFLHRSMLWGCAIQGLGYGFVMPLYAITHLLTSTTAAPRSPALADAVRIRDLDYVRNLPLSILVGYIIPSIFMATPVSSANLHQWLAGFWQGFPVWITLIQCTWSHQNQRSSSAVGEDFIMSNTKRSPRGDRRSEIKALYNAYSFALLVSASTQCLSFGMIWSRNLFPASVSSNLTFHNVFVPPVFYSRAPMKNMAIGIHNFFQYDQYVGSAAALIWAMVLQYNALIKSMTLKHWL